METIDRPADPSSAAQFSSIPPVPRVAWAALFAGAFVSLGLWMLLHVLGMGIGLTAIEPDNPASLRGVGIGTGVWSLIAPLIALFLGGLVAGILAGPMHRVRGGMHGVILWSIVSVASIVLFFYATSAIVGGTTVTASGDTSLPSATDPRVLQAAEDTGKAMIGVFVSLLVGLVSAVFGMALGVIREQRHPTGTAIMGAPPREPQPHGA